MNRKSIAVAVLITLTALLAAPLAAETEEARHRRPRCNDLRAIARFLELTEEQVGQTRAIYGAFRQIVEPLREQIPPLREELAELLDGENPPACEVGQVVVDVDFLTDQIDEAKETADEEFEALLTDEQLVRWEEFQRVCRPGFGR